jgi:50S ribosomal subunit-associated GTPase HflX
VAGVCPISALNRTGIAELLETIGGILEQGKERFHACFSASQGGLLSLLRERGRIVEESYDGDQIYVTALVTPKLAGQMRKLLRTDRGRSQAPVPS